MTHNIFFLVNFLLLLFKIALRSLSSTRQRIVVYKAQDQLLINFHVNKKQCHEKDKNEKEVEKERKR